MRILPLKQDIMYGIVRSRRLKSSLGINLSPGEFKLCSFNCVYCHYGFTKVVTTDATKYRYLFPSPQEVEDALIKRLNSMEELPLYITFSGNGEPAMHPEFPEIVDRVLAVRDRLVPNIKTAILSNSTTAHIPEIREAILKLDVPIMKLDAGDVATFRKTNRPAKEVDFEVMVAALTEMPGITLQTCLFSGSISNSEDDQIDAWIQQVKRIRPQEAQVYTVDRPPADSGLVPVPVERMEAIVKKASKQTGILVKLFGPRRD
jgi:wyosine [tRNA(Phe)-imidazoG37] synthetase (radical SAM superfamily)